MDPQIASLCSAVCLCVHGLKGEKSPACLRVSDLQLCGGAPGRGLLSNNEDGSSLSDVSAISNLSNKVTSD